MRSVDSLFKEGNKLDAALKSSCEKALRTRIESGQAYPVLKNGKLINITSSPRSEAAALPNARVCPAESAATAYC